MASHFSVVAIIVNPSSTGSSGHDTDRLVRDLRDAHVADEVTTMPTSHAGHGTELAYQIAHDHERPLIIAVSGDGGYNEVINGALRAQYEGAHPVCAVVPAGNANDHSRVVGQRPLVQAITAGRTCAIDVLRTTIRSRGDERVRFAHSYVGIGMTPAVAAALGHGHPTRFKEAYVVCKALRDLRPVEIEVAGRRQVVDSVVVANISEMAKVLTIARNATPDDGRLNVTVFPHRRKTALLLALVRAAVAGVRAADAERYEFTPLHDMPMQLDGEMEQLSAGDRVTVSVDPGALSTVR